MAVLFTLVTSFVFIFRKRHQIIAVKSRRSRATYVQRFRLLKVKLEQEDVWFQQDVVTQHSIRSTIEILRQALSLLWQALLAGIILLLWSFVKSNTITSFRHLKFQNIHPECGNLSLVVL